MKKYYISAILILILTIAILTFNWFRPETPTITCQNFYAPGLSKNYFSDGKVRLRNDFKKKYITPKYDWISDVRTEDSLTVFSVDNQRGYLNWFTGKVVIEPQFERAWIFSEGLAGVVKNNKLGFINKVGKMVIEPQFVYIPGQANRVDFLFKNGVCTAIGPSGKQGLINTSGNWALEPQFDYINNPVIGWRIVTNDKKLGVLNPSLELCLPVQYDLVEIVNDGFIVADNGILRIMDFDGQTILQDTIFEQVEPLLCSVGFDVKTGPFYVASGFSTFRVGDKFGVINKKGKVIIPAVYSNVRMLNKDNFLCTKDNYGKVFDSNGKEV